MFKIDTPAILVNSINNFPEGSQGIIRHISDDYSAFKVEMSSGQIIDVAWKDIHAIISHSFMDALTNREACPGNIKDFQWFSICSAHYEYSAQCSACKAGIWRYNLETRQSKLLYDLDEGAWKKKMNFRVDKLEEKK